MVEASHPLIAYTTYFIVQWRIHSPRVQVVRITQVWADVIKVVALQFY